jgi:hypothetical protein
VPDGSRILQNILAGGERYVLLANVCFTQEFLLRRGSRLNRGNGYGSSRTKRIFLTIRFIGGHP